MRDLIRKLDESGERWLLLIFYAYVVIVVFVEVLRRFLLEYSSFWGEETARYMFIYLVWVGAAAAVKDRAHLRIDVLFNLVPERVGAWIYLLGDVLTVLFACLVLWLSLESVATSIRFESQTHGLRISQAWFTAAVPFGFTLILIRLLQSIRRDLADIRAGRGIRTSGKLFD